MRNYSKIVAAGLVSLALVGGSAFAATGTTSQPTKAATKAPVKKTMHHVAKKDDKKAH